MPLASLISPRCALALRPALSDRPRKDAVRGRCGGRESEGRIRTPNSDRFDNEEQTDVSAGCIQR